jgi:hypothetical protein
MWDSVHPGLGWHARSSTAGQEPGHQIPHNRTDQPSQDDRAVISWSSRKPREIVFATAVERQAPTRLRKAPRMTAVAVE